MGKKGGKPKGKKVQLSEFLGDTGSNSVNIGGKAVELPSAPRAATLEIDVTKLPSDPPFTAVLSNLPYDIEDRQIWDFFGDLKITEIDIPREDADGRFKGIAYIIVNGKRDTAIETLAHVLAKSEHMLSGRKVRIEIYQADRRDNRRDRDPGFGRSDDADDWRAMRRDPEPERRGGGYGDRGGGGGGGYGRPRDDYGRNDYGRRGNDRGGFDRDPPRDRGYGDRYGDRDRGTSWGSSGGRDRYDDRPRDRGYDDRGYGGGGRDRGYDDRDRGGYDDRRGGDNFGRGGGGFDRSAADDDRSWRRAEPELPQRNDIREGDRAPPPRRQENERPRLALAPRTKPVDTEQGPNEPPKPSSNPFGAAKPIDTTAKEKEIEAKLKEAHISDRPKKDTVKKLTVEERAAQKAEELKMKIEAGVPLSSEDDNEPVDIGVKSRFELLEDEE